MCTTIIQRHTVTCLAPLPVADLIDLVHVLPLVPLTATSLPAGPSANRPLLDEAGLPLGVADAVGEDLADVDHAGGIIGIVRGKN